LVARLGGEEFVVVLPLTHHENAVKMAERIKQAVEAKTFVCGSADERITVSIGTVTSKFPMDADYLLKFADKALYKAKEKKNMVFHCIPPVFHLLNPLVNLTRLNFSFRNMSCSFA
jgi:diguanylate cyclase (GGDEF)-like protein